MPTENAPAPAQSREELLARMEEASDRLQALIARIPRERLEQPGWGDTGRSLKDEIAHVAAYERWTAEQMERPEPSAHEQSAIFEAAGDIDDLNESIYRDHRDDPLDSVLQESKAAHAALAAAVARLSEEALAAPAWYTGRSSILEFVPIQSYLHYLDHLPDLERAAQQ